MICPHCEFEFDAPAAHCPECGIRIVRKISGIVKTSTVMIATGDENNFYRSLQDVPESLRRQLIETTNSENSGMIVIAEPAAAAEDATTPARGFAGLSWSSWAGVLLFLAAGALIASFFQVFHFGK